MKTSVISSAAFFLACATISGSALAQTATPTQVGSVTYVEPADDSYIELILASTAWAKKSVAKSLAVLQRQDAPPIWQRAIEAAAKRYDVHPITINDYVVVCRNRPATRSTPSERICTMKDGDAVLQFTSVLMNGDSAYVGIGVTSVPKSRESPVTKYQCVALARKNSAWEALKGELMLEVERCPRGGG